MDHELLLSYTNQDPRCGILPAPKFPPDLPTAKDRGDPGCMLPTRGKPSYSTPSALIPLPLSPPGTRLLDGSTNGPHVRVPSPALENPTTRPPPTRNHLPIDGVAQRTIPSTHGLSRVPMVNSHLVSSALAVPPQYRMDNTYSALKRRVREALIEEWSLLFPTPGYYHHGPASSPRPFMGLGKFMAGRIHQITAGKS